MKLRSLTRKQSRYARILSSESSESSSSESPSPSPTNSEDLGTEPTAGPSWREDLGTEKPSWGQVRISRGLFILDEPLQQDFVLIKRHPPTGAFPYYAIRLQRRSLDRCLKKLEKRYDGFDVVCMIRNNPNPICLYNKLRTDPNVSTRANHMRCDVSEGRLLRKIESIHKLMRKGHWPRTTTTTTTTTTTATTTEPPIQRNEVEPEPEPAIIQRNEVEPEPAIQRNELNEVLVNTDEVVNNNE